MEIRFDGDAQLGQGLAVSGCHMLEAAEGRTRGGKVYHAQKASMKPSHEKKKTRPC